MRYFKFIVLFALIMAAITTSFMAPFDFEKKEHRFLLCLSSFKRPIFASGQVFRLMNQTYQNFDISLSMKGVDKHWSDITFEKEWTQLKKDKRLFVRYDPNRGQLHNFLDTVRDFNLDKYDYFCKIDDDDWYAPTYLETVNSELNANPDITISHSINTYILTEDIKSTHFEKNNNILSGPTMCFSRETIRLFLAIEKNPSLLKYYLPNSTGSAQFTVHEDAMMHHVAQNIGRNQYRKATEAQVIYGWQYRSVMRNNNYVKH